MDPGVLGGHQEAPSCMGWDASSNSPIPQRQMSMPDNQH